MLLTPQPLILTLQLDTESQAFFDEQRRKYFPAERNYLNAHLTLFHQLPDTDNTRKIISDLNEEIFEMEVVGLLFLGAGVAYKIESTKLNALHQKLKQEFAAHLIPQDKQGFRPHITVQNKVTSETARQLFNEMNTSFEPFTIKATGLALWRYLGGPWQHVADFPFRQNKHDYC